MKLNQNQIEAIRAAMPELAEQLEAGYEVTVEREVKRWEPMSGGYGVFGDGSFGDGATSERHRMHGVQRRTYDAAQRLAHDQRIFNRLHAYREEFAPGYVVPEIGSSAFFPVFDGEEWESGCAFTFRSASEVYMPRDVCEALCRKLNSGEVVL